MRSWELFLPHHSRSTDFPQGEKCFLQAVRLIYLYTGRNKRSSLKTLRGANKNPSYNIPAFLAGWKIITMSLAVFYGEQTIVSAPFKTVRLAGVLR